MTSPARAVITALTTAGLAACTTPTSPPPSSPTRAASPSSASLGSDLVEAGRERLVDPRGRRTDPEPLTRRLPAIGAPAGVVWFGGTLSDHVPGPTATWFDAVITLTPTRAADLRSRAGALQAVTPAVVPELAPDVPAGAYQGSPRLDDALAGSGYGVRAALSADGRILVLRAVGGG